MTEHDHYAALMRHPVPKATRRKARWPLRLSPPRCDVCKKEPPVCMCKFKPGDGVVYRAYPGATPEQGVVTEVRERGVMVRYDVMGSAKLTPPEMLERLS